MAYYITSGVISSGISLSNDSMYIYDGGVANSTTVNSGGSMIISSGGTATDINWTPCVGHVNAEDGAYVTYASTYSGVYFGSNNQLLSSAQAMNNKVVSGLMYVMSGGVANSTTFNDWGYMFISSGGVANSTTVNSWGYMFISSGGVANSTTVSHGSMYIFSGGVANSTTVSEGSMYIFSGGVANSTTVRDYMYIFSGGVASSAIVNSGGYIHIFSGGVANSITVNSGGSMRIAEADGSVSHAVIGAGGHFYAVADTIFDNITICEGGYYNNFCFAESAVNYTGKLISNVSLYFYDTVLYSGQTLDTVYVDRGDIHILDGAVVKNANLYGDYYDSPSSARYNPGALGVSSGGYAENIYVGSAGRINLEGGYVSSAYVASRGVVDVQAGLVEQVTVASGGDLLFYDSGEIKNITVWNGGSVNGFTIIAQRPFWDSFKDDYVEFENNLIHISSSHVLARGANLYSGQIADNTVLYGKIYSNGILTISSGAIANNTLLTNCTNLEICSGGKAYGVKTSGNCGINLSNGGVLSGAVLNSGVRMCAYYDVELRDMQVNSGAYVLIHDDASDVTVKTGGILWGWSLDHDILVNFSDGLAYLAPQVTIAGATVMVYSGGIASGMTGVEGNMHILSGAIASNTSLKACMHISSGGVANSTTVSAGGGMDIYSGGVANSTTVSGGRMDIYSGGVANSTTMSGGWMRISSGGVANSTTMSGGNMFISSGGVANNTTVNSGGGMIISSGGTATNVIWTPFEGEVYVANGAYVTYANNLFGVYWGSGYQLSAHSNIMTEVTVYYNSMYVFSGGVANSTTVNAGGSMIIGNGGVANNTTIDSSGYMDIYSGGEANSIKVNSGGSMYISSGGTANSTTVNSGGSMYISSGGTANSTTVNSGGSMIISSGGSAIEVKENGGFVYVENGANVTFAFNTITGIVLSGGGMTVHKNTVANSTTINYWGGMYIFSGGVANSTTVSDGSMSISSGGVANSTTMSSGDMIISSGGTANSTIMSCGYMYISSGGIHRGSLQIESGAVVSAYSGSVIDFTVADRTAADGYLINDLSLISGAPSYTITVSATQAFGTYKLAQGAENFTGSITIGDGTLDYGTITVNGNDLVCNDVAYSLDKADGNLTLTVTTPPVISNLKGDANGISWNGSCDAYTVIYSNDNFAAGLQVNTTTKAVDTYGMPGGTYQWKVAADGEEYIGNDIVSDNTTAAQKLISDADGNMDLFFGKANGTWGNGFAAQNAATKELVALNGKNRIQDVFMGSTDANVLVLTDDANGDALFIDDMYSAFGTQARLSQIDEIRAGAGNDIVDLTSDKYAFAGDKLTLFGGAGDDTIWANSGNDIIIGGSGNDSLFGGGGNDTFIFGDNWGNDTVEQLSGGSVTLHFENGSLANWNAETLTYSDGTNSVSVTGTSDITLKFGADASLPAGVFTDAVNEKIFENRTKAMLA